jgi:hypothetical protein
MTNLRTILLVATALPVSTFALSAETSTLKCEEWHPRLGQIADKSIPIDLTAKTCNGQPCNVSDAEFKWKEQNGQAEFTINRTSGEGSVVYQGAAASSYKNCKLIAAKS